MQNTDQPLQHFKCVFNKKSSKNTIIEPEHDELANLVQPIQREHLTTAKQIDIPMCELT